jgi:hypothetical protein
MKSFVVYTATGIVTQLMSIHEMANGFPVAAVIGAPKKAGCRSFSIGNRSSPFTSYAKKSKDKNAGGGEGSNSSGLGMEDAFRQLEKLSSLDDNNNGGISSTSTNDGTSSNQKKKKQKDEAFAKAMKELDLKEILDSTSPIPPVSPESEAELYKDMVSELSSVKSEDELIADLKSDLVLDDDVDMIESTLDAKDEEFMNQAINQALLEAKERNSEVDIDKESLLDNKELMSEIEKIFDKANEKLLEGLEEIRSEQVSCFVGMPESLVLLKVWISSNEHVFCISYQMSLARQSAERNAKISQTKIDEDEQRLALAEQNMKKLLAKVNEETRNVQVAIDDLQRAQEEAEGGFDSQLSSLKSGGLIKQAALAGAVLFTLRSGVDTIGFLGGDPSHALPAILQGALALVCIIALLFF